MTSRLPIILSLVASPLTAADWWNESWTQRQAITIETGESTTKIAAALSQPSVLVRLHEGNFVFDAASPDGSDLRFVGPDGSLIPHEVEHFDSLVREGFVWIRPQSLAPGANQLHLYYGASDPSASPPPSGAHGAALVWHFEAGSTSDSSGNNHNGDLTLTPSTGAIIGNAGRLLGDAPVKVPAGPRLDFASGFTFEIWVRPSAIDSTQEILRRGGFQLVVDRGTPAIALDGETSSSSTPIAAGTWVHLAVSSGPESTKLFINGEVAASTSGTASGLDQEIIVGGAEEDSRFVGEIDELRVYTEDVPADLIRFSAIQQGTTDEGSRTVVINPPEGGTTGGHSAALEHVLLFGDIAKNMMFDGWIAIGVCFVMIGVGWTVAVKKFRYLNTAQRASEAFLNQWKQLSSDLTAIDHSDDQSIRSLGSAIDPGTLDLIHQSPLYRIYHLGSEEIRHRLERDRQRTKGLSGRSIQAIRAALDGGLVSETHKLTRGLVYLTISIAGGPYVGLLGTVVGVMITFAIIAKSGEVDVNSIAPGIASALLATVAGLVVAIPALFIYSYLNSRIKETTSRMQVFIDEFVTKMAEFYPPEGELSPYSPKRPDSAE